MKEAREDPVNRGISALDRKAEFFWVERLEDVRYS